MRDEIIWLFLISIGFINLPCQLTGLCWAKEHYIPRENRNKGPEAKDEAISSADTLKWDVEDTRCSQERRKKRAKKYELLKQRAFVNVLFNTESRVLKIAVVKKAAG